MMGAMGLRSFLHNDRHIQRNSFVWNAVASGLFALQAMVMLLVTQLSVGTDDAGVFAIGLAVAILMGCIGTFGVAPFQASDVKGRFSFFEYVGARLVSVGAMWVVIAIFLVIKAGFGDYDAHKTIIVVLMSSLKTIDVIEGVVASNFQARGRLDIGGRGNSMRTVTNLVVFSSVILATRSLMWALIITVLVTLASFVVIAHTQLKGQLSTKDRRFAKKNIGALLGACTPMFMAWFLNVYANNAPKYFIDATLDNTSQAHFGFLSMPTFVVSLAASFMFNPFIRQFSILWLDGKRRQLALNVLKLAGVILCLGVLAMGAGYLVGIPVLSFLYQTDLTGYLAELMILLLAGTFVALSGFFYAILTIIRKQAILALGYGVVCGSAVLIGTTVVATHELLGAAWMYAAMTASLALIFGVATAIGLWKAKVRAVES